MTSENETTFIGILLLKGLGSTSPVRMPCGFVVAPPESGWPGGLDISCPCGNKSHELVRWREASEKK
jgi:hypothetical protein